MLLSRSWATHLGLHSWCIEFIQQQTYECHKRHERMEALLLIFNPSANILKAGTTRIIIIFHQSKKLQVLRWQNWIPSICPFLRLNNILIFRIYNQNSTFKFINTSHIATLIKLLHSNDKRLTNCLFFIFCNLIRREKR